MPLYEYQCEACGRRTEALQRMSDPPLSACPHCGGALKKLFSAPSFQLKGSGWYATDYAKKQGGKGGGDAGADSAASASSGEPGSPAKEPAPSASAESGVKSGDAGAAKPAPSKAAE